MTAQGSDMRAFDTVVTGMGVVCSTGRNLKEFSDSLLAGAVGIGHARVDGSARDWTAGVVSSVLPPSPGSATKQSTTAHERFAILAACEAVASAELSPLDLNCKVIGVYVGVCQGGLSIHGAGEARHTLRTIADTVADTLGVCGPRIVTSNACSASAGAIAVAAEELQSGRIDAAVVGGADALERFTLEGFDSLGSLDPHGCSPFHRSSGLVVGEGAGFLVLETTASAVSRGAPRRGRLLGWGASADAHHATAPDPTGRGAATAVHRSLTMAGCAPGDVDYVNGHGTGTPANDAMELRAFSAVFGKCASLPPVSSTKSMVGHTLGAASAIESIAVLLGIENGFLPPTVSDAAEPLSPAGCPDFDVVTDRPRPGTIRRALKTSYAFGGSNYALVWGPGGPDSGMPRRRRPRRVPVVTGLGLLGAAGAGVDQWRRVLAAGESTLESLGVRGPTGVERRVLVGLCPEPTRCALISPNVWRRMDRLSRRCVVAAHDALVDAGVEPLGDERQSLMIVFATGSGPVSTLFDYRHKMASGDRLGMALLFPNTAHNAAGGHIATSMGIRGGIVSFTCGPLTSDIALRHAADLIEHGRYDRVLVVVAEELTRGFVELVLDSQAIPLAESQITPFDRSSRGTALSEATVALVLEADDVANRRGARTYGSYLGSGLGRGRTVPTTEAWFEAFQGALSGTGLGVPDVDSVFAAASGLGEWEQAEYTTLSEASGGQVRISAIKSIVGEALGASTAVSSVIALLSLAIGRVPAVVAGTDDACSRVPPRPATGVALVNAVSGAGCCSTAWKVRDEPRSA